MDVDEERVLAPRAARARGHARGGPRARAGCSTATRCTAAWPRAGPTRAGWPSAASTLADVRAAGRAERTPAPGEAPLRALRAHGYTREELQLILGPDVREGAEPLGSMGDDTPLAVLSSAPAPALLLLQAALRAGHEPARSIRCASRW